VVTDAEIMALAQRASAAVDALFALVMQIDRSDPRFTATMRKYGIIQAIQETLTTGADVMTAIGSQIREREAAAAQAPADRVTATMERVNRDRVIMAQQRAAGTMNEADYATAMRELDSLAAQASEWSR
jgi:hypothetical protein